MTESTMATGKASTEMMRFANHRTWSRDMALVGGVSGAAAPLAVARLEAFLQIEVGIYAAMAGIAGAATGVLLGKIMRRALRGRILQVPIVLLLPAGAGAGAIWGATVGAIAGLAVAPLFWGLSVILAATAGALQLGWFWLPYAGQIARNRPTWPVVLAACLVSPLIGLATIIWIT